MGPILYGTAGASETLTSAASGRFSVQQSTPVRSPMEGPKVVVVAQFACHPEGSALPGEGPALSNRAERARRSKPCNGEPAKNRKGLKVRRYALISSPSAPKRRDCPLQQTATDEPQPW